MPRVLKLTPYPTSTSNFSFPLNFGMYFNVLKRHKNAYHYGRYYGVSGCRDSLCDALIRSYEYHEPGETPTPLYKGKASILIGPIKNLKTSLDIIHFVEDELKVKTKTKLYNTDKPCYYIARIDSVWVERTYLLSLWALVFRDAEADYRGDNTPKEFMDSLQVGYWTKGTSAYRVRENYDRMVKNGIYLTPFNEAGRGTRTFGINTVQVPEKY